MARIVLAASGSEGDVHPFIAVARRLKAVGHEPVIASRAGFRNRVEAAGIGFQSMRPDLADLAAAGLDAEAVARGITEPVTALRFLLKRAVLPFLRAAYDDAMQVMPGADLVVTHSFALGARLAAERAGVAWRSAVLQPSAFLSAHDPPVLGLVPLIDALRPALPHLAWRRIHGVMERVSARWMEPFHALRAELGLPPQAAHPLFAGQFAPGGVLALYSPLMGGLQPDYPPGVMITGFPFEDEAGEGPALEPGLVRFLDGGEPPVVFTLGSGAVLNPGDFFSVSLEAARRAGRRAVLVGPGPDLAGVLPEGVFACAYAPYGRLFPRAGLIVHPGGIGTSAQALRAGRPQLVVPVVADQPDNARRLARLGVARVLARPRYEPGAVAKALEALGDSARIGRAARETGRLVGAEDGAGAAARVIEGWL